MKNVKLIALVLVAICLLVLPLAWSQGGNPPASTKESGKTSGHGMTAVEQINRGSENLEQQIKTLTEQMAQAQLKGDTSFYDKYYADDVLVVHNPGTLGTKAEEIDDLKSGALKYDSYEMRDIKIHTYNGDTAVVDYVATTKGVIKGKPFSGDFRVSRVWVKQEGNWKVVLFQTAHIAQSK